MSDLLSKLASQAGVSEEQAKQGMGAILKHLKDKLPADSFGQVQKAVPNSLGMIDAAKSALGGGILSVLLSRLGLGGGLLGSLAKIGLSSGQIQAFLPKAIEMLKGVLTPDLMAKIMKLLGGLAAPK
jgi:hypothetical protein